MLNHNHSPQEYLLCMVSIGWQLKEAVNYYRGVLALENKRLLSFSEQNMEAKQ